MVEVGVNPFAFHMILLPAAIVGVSVSLANSVHVVPSSSE